MRSFVLFALLACFASACGVKKNLNADKTLETVADDSTTYEITFSDPQFERWYQTNFSPAVDRDNSYYQSRNRIGVLNWNDYFVRGKYRRVISSYLPYSPAEDYGIEVNRRLYWYFKFMEESYRIPLLR